MNWFNKKKSFSQAKIFFFFLILSQICTFIIEIITFDEFESPGIPSI